MHLFSVHFYVFLFKTIRRNLFWPWERKYLKKIADILGMRVVDNRGNLVGSIEKAVFTRDRSRLLGVLVKAGRMSKNTLAIRFQDIISIGDDAVIINQGAAVDPSRLVEIANALDEHVNITGYNVYTDSGDQMGTIKDIMIDERSGKVQGFLVAADLIEDLVNGRRMLTLDQRAVISEDRVIIPDENYQNIGAFDVGLKRFLDLEG
jgi:uncharacterized protein YrrD